MVQRKPESEAQALDMAQGASHSGLVHRGQWVHGLQSPVSSCVK